MMTGCANYKPYQRLSSMCLGAECIGQEPTNFDYEAYDRKLNYIGIGKPITVTKPSDYSRVWQ